MTHAVLIVEDEATLAKNIKQYLDGHGFEARIVASAEHGLKQLDEYKSDVILLDFRLPGKVSSVRWRTVGNGPGTVGVATTAAPAYSDRDRLLQEEA